MALAAGDWTPLDVAGSVLGGVQRAPVRWDDGAC